MRFFIKDLFSFIFFVIALAFSFIIVVVRNIYRVVDWLYSWIEKGVLIFAMIVITLAGFIPTIDRKVEWINPGWFVSTKLTMFLMIWVDFLGACFATKRRSHLAIDVAGKVLTPKGAKAANFWSL